MREKTPGRAGKEDTYCDKGYKQAFHALNLSNLINQFNFFAKQFDKTKYSFYICSPKNKKKN